MKYAVTINVNQFPFKHPELLPLPEALDLYSKMADALGCTELVPVKLRGPEIVIMRESMDSERSVYITLEGL
jgi:hypothetical protein